jgi:uncharacterized membrane protein
MNHQPDFSFDIAGLTFASIFLLMLAVLAVFGFHAFFKKSQHANRQSMVSVIGGFACIMAVVLFFVIAASFVGYKHSRTAEVAQVTAADQARQFAIAQKEKALREASRYDLNNPGAEAPFDSASDGGSAVAYSGQIHPSQPVDRMALLPIITLIVLVGLAIVGFVKILNVSRKSTFESRNSSFLKSVWTAMTVMFFVIPVMGIVFFFFWMTLAPSSQSATPATSTNVVSRSQAIGAESAIEWVFPKIDNLASTSADAPVVAPKPKLASPVTATVKSTLPTWVEQGDVTEGATTLKVISSERFATVEESERQAMDEAQMLMREYFRKSHQASGYWKMPVELLQAAFQKDYTEEIDHNFGTFTETMYRTHLQLKLSPEVRETFYQPWRSQIVELRMWQLGYLLFFATFILGAFTWYFRLDAYTNGAYRSRFKFATTLVIVGGSIALLCVA